MVGLPAAASVNAEPSLAPLNPEFVDYIAAVGNGLLQGGGDGITNGLIPEPVDWSHNSTRQLLQVQAEPTAVLPAFYDLRAQGKLTAVRNQGSCGCCWAFASIGSLESTLMPAENWDFSENNLKNLSGFVFQCCSGGNRAMSTAYLARWDGPVLESDDAYNAGSCASPAGRTARKHVQKVLYIPNRSGPLDNDLIKQAVMDYGAVYSTYYHNDAYYNSVHAAYYFNGASNSNHAICIVGWDDNFDKSKFFNQPPGNGAFIVRNSWGNWWGQNGYFYLSYYDSVLGTRENAVFLAEPTSNYSRVYQYDPLGQTASTGYGGNTAWFANVFTAVGNESLSAVSFYAASSGSTYELYVYKSPTNGPKGTQALFMSGSIATAGYHTIPLTSAVQLTAGQKFSVAVKLTTPGYGYPIPLERPIGGYASPTASPGQSYMSSNGNVWTDVTNNYSNSNVCLKAFTVQPAASLSVSPGDGLASSGAIGGPFNPLAKTYTLSNTGSLPLNW